MHARQGRAQAPLIYDLAQGSIVACEAISNLIRDFAGSAGSILNYAEVAFAGRFASHEARRAAKLKPR
jgi:hypothetical protein